MPDHAEFARRLAEQGRDADQIERALVRTGLDPLEAQVHARKAVSDHDAEAAAVGSSGSGSPLMFGLIAVALGVVAFLVISAASDGSVNPRIMAKFVIGVVVFGGYRLMRGLSS